MIEVIFLFLIGLIWIIFASVQDVRTREVANWISFSLIIFALGFRFFYSLFNNEFNFFYQGLIGFLIFFALGNLLYYARMFAGGDSKLMQAMGPVLGFSLIFAENLKFYLIFFFLFLFSGAIYGLVMTVVISLKNKKLFRKGFKEYFRKSKKMVYFISGIGVAVCALGFYYPVLFSLGIIILLFPYFYLLAKVVDNYCMVKRIKSKDLTEGDWLNSEMKVAKRVINPTWDGLSISEIRLLKKKYKYVKIKQGIVFVPVFLVSYLVYFYVYITGLANSLF